MLLELPAEIRECIYQFALTSSKPLVTFHIDEYQREVYDEAILPPLLFVNHQIRNEALHLFYSSNDFIFFTEGLKSLEAEDWLNHFRQHVPRLGGASFWVRHHNPARTHIGPSGAYSITMRPVPRREDWHVTQCHWISPVRKPVDYNEDGTYISKELQRLIKNKQLTVDLLIFLMGKLRQTYIRHKQGRS